jgi:hypothetical protein
MSVSGVLLASILAEEKAKNLCGAWSLRCSAQPIPSDFRCTEPKSIRLHNKTRQHDSMHTSAAVQRPQCATCTLMASDYPRKHVLHAQAIPDTTSPGYWPVQVPQFTTVLAKDMAAPCWCINCCSADSQRRLAEGSSRPVKWKSHPTAQCPSHPWSCHYSFREATRERTRSLLHPNFMLPRPPPCRGARCEV